MIKYYGADKDYGLSGKAAIITGGAAGIGLATAKFFALKGAAVLIADINPEADSIARSISGDFMGVSGDVRDAGYRAELIKKADERFGKVDILVNCAGIVRLERAEDISEDDWDGTLEINLKASFMMAQAAGRYMIEKNSGGSIVNMGSQAGVIALERHVAYCASKGAVIAMGKVLAMEWGQYGIRVNTVSPTVVLTELGHKAWDGAVGEEFKRQMPSGRFAEPDEIAAAIAFLCGDGAAMITGHNLVIDGGYTIK